MSNLCCGTWDLCCILLNLLFWHLGSVVAALRLSCPMACGILVPRPGVTPTSPALQGEFLTPGPPGSPHILVISNFRRMLEALGSWLPSSSKQRMTKSVFSQSHHYDTTLLPFSLQRPLRVHQDHLITQNNHPPHTHTHYFKVSWLETIVSFATWFPFWHLHRFSGLWHGHLGVGTLFHLPQPPHRVILDLVRICR